MGKTAVHHLELRIRDLSQLFNSLDPTPFLNKDLDQEAEAYIETWARTISPKDRLHLTIHMDSAALHGDSQAVIEKAIHNHFTYRAELAQRDLSELLKEGRTALLIGLLFLSACLAVAQTLTQLFPGTWGSVLREGLFIVGWVAMWRPIEIFLYTWWPLVRKIAVYRNLSRIHVRVITQARDKTPGQPWHVTVRER